MKTEPLYPLVKMTHTMLDMLESDEFLTVFEFSGFSLACRHKSFLRGHLLTSDDLRSRFPEDEMNCLVDVLSKVFYLAAQSPYRGDLALSPKPNDYVPLSPAEDKHCTGELDSLCIFVKYGNREVYLPRLLLEITSSQRNQHIATE